MLLGKVDDYVSSSFLKTFLLFSDFFHSYLLYILFHCIEHIITGRIGNKISPAQINIGHYVDIQIAEVIANKNVFIQSNLQL